jgi:Fe-S cluster assembly protein SufD
MTQALTTERRYHSDFQALEQGLRGEPGWLRSLRQRAWSRFAELGFPTGRRGNEAWKYTNVAPIAATSFVYPEDSSADLVEASDLKGLAPGHDLWTTLVFVNGRYAPALSGGPPARNARVTSLADAAREDGATAEQHLAHYAGPEEDGFVALNTAFLRDGALVHGTAGQAQALPIHLLFVATGEGEPTVTYPRTLIVAEPGSSLTVLESYVSLSGGPAFTDAVTEIVAADGAQIHHYRMLMEHPDSFHIGTTRVVQGRDSSFTSTSFSTGDALARNDFQVLLDAPGASCVLNGLYLTDGTQHIDNHVVVDHAKPHTTSRLYYKGILDGSSKAVFSGRVLVRPNAQKTDARQYDRNLILSEGAEVDSKPSLEIFADDVRCYHGATAGHIDEEALFYMQSRGLDLGAARGLLVRAFASEIIDAIQLEPLRAYLDQLFLGALPGPGGQA